MEFFPKDSTVCTVDGLLSLAHARLLLVGRGLDTLELESGDGTFGNRGSLLQVLEYQFTAGGTDGLDLIGPGVVGEATPVGDTLNHFHSVNYESKKMSPTKNISKNNVANLFVMS